MSSFKRKMDALDPLVTHTPKTNPQKAVAPSIGTGQELSATGRERLEDLRNRIARANDRNEVEALLEQVQSEFGNQAAERMVKELRLDEDEPNTT